MRTEQRLVTRARLTPETAKIRNAVSDSLAAAGVVPGDLVLVACSGGQDSLALAIAAAFVGKRDGIQIGAVVVDHQLQTNSAEVARRAALTCERIGLNPVVVKRATVKVQGEGIEAAARTARYLEIETARVELNAKFVLLGHTLDDQAETVLLGLSRGSGIHSISGMNAHSGSLLRPLLHLSRRETAAVCESAGIEYWDDPHNFDPSFTRVRIRKNVIPILERELGTGFAEALARTAELAREDDSELIRQAEHAFSKFASTQSTQLIRLPVADISSLPRAVAKRVVQIALRQLDSVATYVHLNSVLALIENWHGQQALDLPGVKVERAGDELILRTSKRQPSSRDEA